MAAPRPHRARCRCAGLTAAALAAAALVASSARAAPTIWARASDPWIDFRASLIAEANAILLQVEQLQRSPLKEQVEQIAPLWLREARSRYDRAGAARSPDAELRLKYIGVLEDLGDYARAAALLEDMLGVAAGSSSATGQRPRRPTIEPAAPFRAEAWRELAICDARLGKHREEIKAYAEALALEPHSGTRSVLLANRAEASMALGDITSAIDGYRASIATLSSRELPRYGVTTLWGLAVALDRSGDLDGAFESIELARSYDRADLLIHSPGWFYVPSYDEAWYKALGHWTAARAAELVAVRMEMYAQAISAWKEYLQLAPNTDPWLPLAKARLERCEKERDQARPRRAAPATRQGAGAPP